MKIWRIHSDLSDFECFFVFICVTVSMFEERNVTECHILRSVLRIKLKFGCWDFIIIFGRSNHLLLNTLH